MIDVELYLKALKLDKLENGAQELILGEIIGCFSDCKTIWLPYGGRLLSNTLKELKFVVIDRPFLHRDEEFDALYFGTPTILDDKMLFIGQFNGNWNKEIERRVVRSLCERAITHKAHCIVCGLGEGDISAQERIFDIKSSTDLIPKVVAIKSFVGFTDIVIEAR